MRARASGAASPRSVVAVLAAALLLTGCATASRSSQTGGGLVSSSTQVPERWPLPPMPVAQARMPADPVLAGILADIAVGPDMAAARARLLEAEAGLQVARSALAPSATLTANAARGTAPPGFGPPGAGRIDSRSAALALEVPLDIAGSNRARAAAATARVDLAAAEAERIALVSRRTGAALYRAALVARQQQALIADAVAVAAETVRLTDIRVEAGLASGLEQAETREALAAIRARQPAIAQAAAAAQFALEALAGQAPGTYGNRLEAAAAGPLPAGPGLGLLDSPAAVLARRPDVRAAQAALQAAGLDARAAERERWPSLSLSALLGWTDPGFAAAADTDSIGIALLAPVFDFGRLQGLAQAAGARAEVAAADYAGTLARAMQDVATEASRLGQAQAARASQSAAAQTASTRARLVADRQAAGLSSLIEVLRARANLLEAQLAEATALGEEATAGYALAAALALPVTADRNQP